MKPFSFFDYQLGFGASGGCWIQEPTGMEIYIRRSIRVKGGFELANIELPKRKQHKGILKSFLQAHRDVPLLIENVLNSLLENWLLKQSDWSAINPDYIGLSATYVNTTYRKHLNVQHTHESGLQEVYKVRGFSRSGEEA